MRGVHLSFALAMALQAAHLTFVRTVPPPYDLAPAQRLAVIYAIGDSDKVTTFVQQFVEYVARGGALRIENAVENNAALKTLRREHPADAYIGVSVFTCSAVERSAEGSERDVDGSRVRRMHMWIDAGCQARLDVRRADGRRLFTFNARGEGTSPRAVTLTAEERDVAYEQAARYAALNAAEMITPRFARETIELDETAPAFEEGLAMIHADRLEDARAIWEASLRQHRDSAPLHYNLGAIAEALGDVKAANEHFQSAVRLSPRERRYRTELDLLHLRNK
jgi:tetratricopeptide (TPR) repeat protein